LRLPLHRSRATSKEGRALAAERAAAIADLPLRSLDVYGSKREVVAAESGRRYVVSSVAYWDSEPWESMLYVIVRVRPTEGWWRLLRPYSAVVTRSPPS
jgi:hypothetical protein